MDVRRWIQVGIGVGVGAVIGALAAPIFFGQNERPDTNVSLDVDSASGRCVAADPIALKSKTKKNVKWHITNNCKEPQFVRMTQFRPKNSNGTLGPEETDTITPYPATTASAIGLGQTMTLTAMLSKDDGRKEHYFYKYEIWIGSTQEGLQRSRDPDIEMWDH